MSETNDDGCCRTCRYWNGASERPAFCFKIQGGSGRLFELAEEAGAAFYDFEPGGRRSYLVTSPDFSCARYEPGRPRFYGDDGRE